MRTFRMFLLSALLAVALPARALTVLPATFEELVRESVSVVHGRVREVQGRWTSDRRTIESTITLDVYDAFKGAVTDTATFVVPGGEAGGRILVMPGAPTFRAGDEVVVFLRGRAPSMPQPVGLSLGVYRVAHPAPGGTALVMPSPVNAAGTPTTIRRGTSARQVRALADFGAAVRAVGEAR